MNRKDLVILLTMVVLVTVFGVTMAYVDNRIKEAQRIERMRHWYDCTLPNGQVVRVNWVHTSRGEWEISTGKEKIVGSGNLTCIEVK